MDEDRLSVARWMTTQAAVLILLALLTGILVAAAATGKVPADPHSALASHLNAFMGAFWIFGVVVSLPHLGAVPGGVRALAYLVVLGQYANWLFTALKAFWQVPGIDLTDDAHNNIIFALLNGFVVLPSLAAAVLWIVALRRGRKP